jgi:hypothetical protein
MSGRVPGSPRAAVELCEDVPCRGLPLSGPAPVRRGLSSTARTSSVTVPLRIKALGGAVVELGDVTLTTADWGYKELTDHLRDQLGISPAAEGLVDGPAGELAR